MLEICHISNICSPHPHLWVRCLCVRAWACMCVWSPSRLTQIFFPLFLGECSPASKSRWLAWIPKLNIFFLWMLFLRTIIDTNSLIINGKKKSHYCHYQSTTFSPKHLLFFLVPMETFIYLTNNFIFSRMMKLEKCQKETLLTAGKRSFRPSMTFSHSFPAPKCARKKADVFFLVYI